ncbi:MAG: peptidylprolyl isomerase [Bacteroidaceae bacterium]|nr:peptidylprolyl isomerase [Bacteroidaceae bacterium]
MLKFISILIFSSVALNIFAQSNVVDEVIWVVGDDPILLSDVEEARLQAEADGKVIEDPYCTIPEQLAIQKLFLHQAAIDSVEVSDAQVLKLVNERINYFIQNLGSRENVEKYFSLPLPQIKEKLARTMRQQNMVQQVQSSLTRNIKVTPAEVRSYFKDLPADSLPLIPTQVEVQIVTTHPQPTRQEVENIESRLREFARRVNEGETEFSTLAKIYSQDPGTARVGGECGYSGRNQFVPEFSNVAFSLNDPTKVSKIVKTEFGYHIIQLIDKQGDKVNVRHILLKPNIADSVFEAEMARLDSISNDVKSNKFTFEEAAIVLSDDKDTKKNNGLMVNFDRENQNITSKFMMKDLPAEIAKQVATMSVGDISKSFIYVNERGQQVCAIIKLKSRVESHRATITDDFQVLKDVVLEKRRTEKLNTWIKNKQKTTYVRINPEWKNCTFQYPDWLK